MISHTEIVLAAKKAAADSNVDKEQTHTFVSGFIVGAIYAQEPKKRERKPRGEYVAKGYVNAGAA